MLAPQKQMGPPPVPTDPMAMSIDSLLSGIGRTLEEAAAANSAAAMVARQLGKHRHHQASSRPLQIQPLSQLTT